jgi:hypothetical protein
MTTIIGEFTLDVDSIAKADIPCLDNSIGIPIPSDAKSAVPLTINSLLVKFIDVLLL